MSTTHPTHPAPSPGPTLDISQTARVPFSRLVRVEWRKMLDTRGGFWLMVATGILLMITVGLVLLVVALTDEPLEIGSRAPDRLDHRVDLCVLEVERNRLAGGQRRR